MRSSLACWNGLSVSPGEGQTACLYLSQRGERAVQKLGVWIKEYRSNTREKARRTVANGEMAEVREVKGMRPQSL